MSRLAGLDKVRKPVLLHEFIEHTPVTDGNDNDLIYFVKGGVLQEFTTREYRREMDRCMVPMVRSRFAAMTRRQDILGETMNKDNPKGVHR